MSAVSQTRTAYCEVVATQKFMSNKIIISLDFGQEQQKKSFWGDGENLVDENGKAIVFNSVVDALNYMGVFGWELVTTYAIGNANSGYVHHFLMAKKLNGEDVIGGEFQTRQQYKENRENTNTKHNIEQKAPNDTTSIDKKKKDVNPELTNQKQEQDYIDDYRDYDMGY